MIAPPPRVAETAATLNLVPGPDLDAPVAVLSPEQAKGLEFDSVIIVDPAGIEQGSPRGRADLYVALTRTTRRLGLLSPGEMPRDLMAVLDQSPTHITGCTDASGGRATIVPRGDRSAACGSGAVAILQPGKACWSRTAISFSTSGTGSGWSIPKRKAPDEVE